MRPHTTRNLILGIAATALAVSAVLPVAAQEASPSGRRAAHL